MISEIYFKMVVFVLVIFFFVIRIIFTFHFRFSRRRLFRLLFVVLVLSLYFSSAVSFASMNIPEGIRIFDGGLLILVSLLIFYMSHRALGENWTSIIDSGESATNVKKIIKIGPYRYVRHPIYGATFLLLLGFWVFVSNWILGGVPFILFYWIYFIKIDNEERSLVKKFGRKYKDYMKNTGRLFFKIR